MTFILPCSPTITRQGRFDFLESHELESPYWKMLEYILSDSLESVTDVASLINVLETISVLRHMLMQWMIVHQLSSHQLAKRLPRQNKLQVYSTTGYVANITYSNIQVRDASVYGIDVQQDYLDGGPTRNPSNGVLIENLSFVNVVGTASSTASDYYILCGDGSCEDFVFENVRISGGGVASSCNYPAGGCP